MVIETLIGTAIGYLTSTIKASKGGQKASDEMSEAIWKWIRPIFLMEDKKKEDLKKFEEQPDVDENKKAVADSLFDYLKEKPDQQNQLSQLLDQLKNQHPEHTGNVYNYAPIEKQVNNPNIQGDFHM